MKQSFNLLDCGWIPCLMLDGTIRELGLFDVLVNAQEIREVLGDSSLVVVAIHRLLLAVLHRNFGPESASAWYRLWAAEAFDESVLSAYTHKWRKRFDLCDAERPFYQDSSLPDKWLKPIGQLVHETSPTSASALFSHTTASALPVSVAARYLLAQQSYALGGTLSREKGEKPSGPGGRLVSGVCLIYTGQTLFQTLMLNMIRYSVDDDEPVRFRQVPEGDDPDRPSWECAEPNVVGPRPVRGYLDYLTWQMRRIRLVCEVGEDGSVVVTRSAIAGGAEFLPSFYALDPTMVYLPDQSSDDLPWNAWKPKREVALWRNSLALISGCEVQPNRLCVRPQVTDWIATLSDSGYLSERYVRANVIGLWHRSGQQVSIYHWRHEILPLAIDYLRDGVLIDALRRCLTICERSSTCLEMALEHLAPAIALPEKRQHDLSRNDKDSARKASAKFDAPSVYWASLDLPFRELLERLPRACEARALDAEVRGWAVVVRDRATKALDTSIDRLRSSGRNLRAAVSARAVLHRGLDRLLPKEEVKQNAESL